MELKRGAISYSIDEHMEAVKKNKYIDAHHQMTLRISSYLDVLRAQFRGTYMEHSFLLINTSLIDYFLSKKELLSYDNVQYLHDDLCGWRNSEFLEYLKSNHVDLENFKYKYLKYSDFCYELYSLKEVDGSYLLVLPDEKNINLSEADFYALCILCFNYLQPTDYKEDGYWFDSPQKALDKWESLPESHKDLIGISIYYNRTVHTEYWFSIINELFTYFQNALIRNGHKVAISKEKSRIAKIKAEKEAKEREPKLQQLESLWDAGDWSSKGHGKYTKFAKHITYNDMVDGIEFDAIRTHISNYDKNKNR